MGVFMKNLGVFKVIVPSCDGFLRMYENLERHLGRLWASLGIFGFVTKLSKILRPWAPLGHFYWYV